MRRRRRRHRCRRCCRCCRGRRSTTLCSRRQCRFLIQLLLLLALLLQRMIDRLVLQSIFFRRCRLLLQILLLLLHDALSIRCIDHHHHSCCRHGVVVIVAATAAAAAAAAASKHILLFKGANRQSKMKAQQKKLEILFLLLMSIKGFHRCNRAARRASSLLTAKAFIDGRRRFNRLQKKNRENPERTIRRDHTERQSSSTH